MTDYAVVVIDDGKPWVYGPFPTSEQADAWRGNEQNEEGVVNTLPSFVVVLNSP